MEPQAKAFESQIEDINNQFFSVLDDFKHYYVSYNLHPESNEYQTYFLNSQNTLQDLNKKILALTTTIQSKILELDNKNIKSNTDIYTLKKKYEDLVKLQNGLDMTEDGSDKFINDSKELYNQQYHKNVVLFLGLLLLISFSIKSFSNSQNVI